MRRLLLLAPLLLGACASAPPTIEDSGGIAAALDIAARLPETYASWSASDEPSFVLGEWAPLEPFEGIDRNPAIEEVYVGDELSSPRFFALFGGYLQPWLKLSTEDPLVRAETHRGQTVLIREVSGRALVQLSTPEGLVRVSLAGPPGPASAGQDAIDARLAGAPDLEDLALKVAAAVAQAPTAAQREERIRALLPAGVDAVEVAGASAESVVFALSRGAIAGLRPLAKVTRAGVEPLKGGARAARRRAGRFTADLILGPEGASDLRLTGRIRQAEDVLTLTFTLCERG